MASRALVTATGLVACTLVSATAAAALAETAASPRPWLRSVIDRGLALSHRKVDPGTDAETRWRADAKALIDDTLDWPELTQQALGARWKEISDAQRKEFAALLREMVEASYQSKLKLVVHGEMKKPEQVRVEWLDEKLKGDEATVTTRGRSDKQNATFEFKLRWRNGRWRIWDVAIDDVSTVRTYRTQFNQIIARDGFDGLIAKMRRKTDEIRAGRAELGP